MCTPALIRRVARVVRVVNEMISTFGEDSSRCPISGVGDQGRMATTGLPMPRGRVPCPIASPTATSRRQPRALRGCPPPV